MKFIMLIGLPGCGKSTYAKSLVQNQKFDSGVISGKTIEGEPITILSSDSLRDFYGFEPGKGSSECFDKMEHLTCHALNLGVSVIYDATNLVQRRRIAILRKIAKYDVEKVCVLFTEPISVVQERNRQRDPKWIVPDEVIMRMLKSFQVPMQNEGFDKIERIQTVQGEQLEYYLEKSKGFKQENDHHTLDLYDHMKKTSEILLMDERKHMSDNIERLAHAGLYHDIGKLYTKDFHDARGNVSKDAHYYQHENVGAYVYLTAYKDPEIYKDLDLYNELYVARLINWHMRSYQNVGEKKAMSEMLLMGVSMYTDLSQLHLADMRAH